MADLDTNTNTDTASAVAPNGAPVISDIAADEDAYRRQQQELSRSVAEALNGDAERLQRALACRRRFQFLVFGRSFAFCRLGCW